MIQAWRYVHGTDGHDLVAADNLVDAIAPGKALLWVDVADPSSAELESIATQLGVHQLVLEDLHHGGQRTKLEHHGTHFHVAVHDCTLDKQRLVTREVDVVFSDGWLVSVRQPSADPENPAPFDVVPVARRFELERGTSGDLDEGLLLWALLDVIVDRYFDVLDTFDDQLEATEEIVFESDGRENVPREVFDLRRALVHFRRVVAPLREVLAELLRREAECLGPVAIVRMQDVYDHVLRVADLVDSQRDLVTGLLEANLAVASNRMNDVMKRMTSWGAILLGASLIAGIYGMNFVDMPGLESSYGYPAALGAMAVLTITLYIWFKRRDWL